MVRINLEAVTLIKMSLLLIEGGLYPLGDQNE
jgi:hypothetical protein